MQLVQPQQMHKWMHITKTGMHCLMHYLYPSCVMHQMIRVTSSTTIPIATHYKSPHALSDALLVCQKGSETEYICVTVTATILIATC